MTEPPQGWIFFWLIFSSYSIYCHASQARSARGGIHSQYLRKHVGNFSKNIIFMEVLKIPTQSILKAIMDFTSRERCSLGWHDKKNYNMVDDKVEAHMTPITVTELADAHNLGNFSHFVNDGFYFANRRA